jgi:hypothetical protein
VAKSIDYGQLTLTAFRRLMADVLSDVAANGLPGDHHFYIVFDTRHPGVDMAASLKERYPDEMTIVLQEWFEDLAVMSDRFSVTLNFGNVPQPIVVPFKAVKTFADPSAEFGLRFDGKSDDDERGEVEAFMKAAGLDRAQSGSDDDEERGEGAERKAEVVSLDKFRKH